MAEHLNDRRFSRNDQTGGIVWKKGVGGYKGKTEW